MAPVLTVIIPTVCTAARRASLLRAIASAHQSASTGVVTVLVVANGDGVVDAVLAEISKLPFVSILRCVEGSPPKAQLAGRRSVITPYFSFLDDDDELLPGASEQRLRALQQEPAADLAVSNGLQDLAGERELMHPDLGGVAAAPLQTLLKRNWLASCAAAFRTATVGVEFFEEPQPYAEWTWLGYRLFLAGKRVAVIEQPGYVVNDTPGSLSKSSAYTQSYVGLFDRMLACDPPKWVRETVQRKRCAALHDLADQALSAANISDGWKLHLSSLRPWRFGLRYFWFGRKLLAKSIWTRRA